MPHSVSKSPCGYPTYSLRRAGRLHRLHDSKKVVRIYDYVDTEVPMLVRMYKKRLQGYGAIGYSVKEIANGFEPF